MLRSIPDGIRQGTLALALALTPLPSHAGGALRSPATPSLVQEWRASLKASYVGAVKELAALERLPAPTAASQSQCSRHFRNTFASGVAQLTVTLGYGDDEDTRVATDQLEQQELVNVLTAPCESGSVQVCGFVQDGAGSDEVVTHLSKRFLSPEGEFREIKLAIASPSVSEDDDVNRRELSAQNARGQRVAELFMNGFRDSQAVFYLGHNRKAGGPDFWPAKHDRKGEIDDGWYSRRQPGLAYVERGLNQRDPKMNLLELLGCHTTRTVWPMLKRRHSRQDAGLAVFSTHSLISSEDQAKELFRTLNGMMNERCAYAYYNIHRKGDVLHWWPGLELPRDIIDFRAVRAPTFVR